MKPQRFRPWRPLENIPSLLYLHAVHDDWEGLRFILRGKGDTESPLRVTFKYFVGYRNIDESYRLNTVMSIDRKDFSTLMMVENSRWVQWLVEESAGTLSADKLNHYAIYTPDPCIDIVAESPPIVEWLWPD